MSWFFWLLLGIFLFFFLIFMIRISLITIYEDTGVKATVKVGFVSIRLYPRPEKDEKKPKKEKAEKAEEEIKQKKGGTIQKLKAGLKIIKPIFQQVRRRLVISKLVLHYTAASDDAAKTAFAYGGAHMAVNQILPMLHGMFKVKKQDIQIKGDFDSTEDHIYLEARIRITVWSAMRLGLFTLKKLREVGIITKKEGAKHERKETSN